MCVVNHYVIFSTIVLAATARFLHQQPQCNNIAIVDRIDCWPGGRGVNSDACVSRGCCFNIPQEKSGLGADVKLSMTPPICFFPTNYPNYKVTEVNTTSSGYSATLVREIKTFWPNDIMKLQLNVIYHSENTLRFQIIDPNNNRWQPPITLQPAENNVVSRNYDISINHDPVGIRVWRKSDNQLLFNMPLDAPLIFSDQFLQITSSLNISTLYGFGERRSSIVQTLNQWTNIALWNRDVAPMENANLYGLHNFFVGMPESGQPYGVFFLNSNAQEMVLQPSPRITYRAIGGIIDFFIFTGRSPSEVVSAYYLLVGLPALPPFWSLGFHLSRWGYGTLSNTENVWNRTRETGIPFDVQWNDIDYMSKFRDWTYDGEAFNGLPGFVDKLHSLNMHYVMIVDPAISNEFPGSYPPYDIGLQQGVFITKSNTLTPLVGKVWPGTTVFPDFTNPKTVAWWINCSETFNKEINFDGLWIDMNEPSNFVDGSIDGCTQNSLDNPPYTPAVLDNSLIVKTICPSSNQSLSTHYNLHNMYGYSEAVATHAALQQIKPGKRSFLLSRSSFAGSGRYTFHWSGDNNADWNNMFYSVSQILSFNLFAIPMVGADICGFQGDSNEELCVRWMTLGAFYPFMRNHNTIGSRDQDPGAWSANAIAIMKLHTSTRYALLPYFYRLFLKSSYNGTTIASPLWMEFSNDRNTHAIDTQFMLGPNLMVSPVLKQGASIIDVYFPDALWCDGVTGRMIQGRKTYVQLQTPMEYLPLHIRGGSVIPSFEGVHSARTKADLLNLPYNLMVCLDENANAIGEINWDDGESLNPAENLAMNNIHINVTSNRLETTQSLIGYKTDMILMNVIISSMASPPVSVTLNGVPFHSFTFKQGIFFITNINATLLKDIEITWSMS